LTQKFNIVFAFPQLLAAYEHKERFYGIWDATLVDSFLQASDSSTIFQ